MKPISQIGVFSVCAAISYGIMGAGGQVQVNNPIFGEDCVATIPSGLELIDCEFVASSPSGLQTFFVCGDIPVTCNSEDGGAPGQIKKDN